MTDLRALDAQLHAGLTGRTVRWLRTAELWSSPPVNGHVTHWLRFDDYAEIVDEEARRLRPIPHYSTDDAAAISLLRRLTERYDHVALHAANGWGLTCWNVGEDGVAFGNVGPVNAETPAEAIARTALEVFS